MGKPRCPTGFPRCLGVFGEKSSILRFRVCRIRDETFTQQSRSVGGQCFFPTLFSSRRFFWGGMWEESGVVMGKVEFIIERVLIEMQRIQSVMIIDDYCIRISIIILSSAKQHAGIFRYFGSFI